MGIPSAFASPFPSLAASPSTRNAPLLLWVLGFQDFGFRVQGLGLRVEGRGFGVQGLGFRVQGLGFRIGGSSTAEFSI